MLKKYCFLIVFVIVANYAFCIEPKVSEAEGRVLASVEVLNQQKQYTKALGLLEKQETLSRSAALLYAKATCCVYLKQYEEAINSLESSLNLAPGFSRALRLLAKILMEKERYAEAVKHLQVLRRTFPEEVELSLYIGHCLVYQNNFAAAEVFFREVIKHDPWHRDAILSLARGYQSLERFADVEKMLLPMLSKYPKQKEFWLLSAQAAQGQGKDEESLAYLMSAHKLGLLERKWQLQLVFRFLNQKAVIPAVAVMKQLSGSGKAFLDSQYLEAFNYLISAGFSSEVESILDSVNLSELMSAERVSYNILKADILFFKEKWSDALSIYKNVLKKRQADVTVLRKCAMSYDQLGEFDNAIEAYRSISILKKGSDYNSLLALVRLSAAKGQTNKAIDYAKKALLIKQDSALVQYLAYLRGLKN